jgi:hypothetical protein
MVHYRYDMIGAYVDHHIKKHPEQDMIDRGFNWIKCEPFSIADCWIFRFDSELNNSPDYLVRISDDFKFSGED